ncbi:MAG: hypothetical protein R2879_00700 [Saprospiraceae bacterium]
MNIIFEVPDTECVRFGEFSCLFGENLIYQLKSGEIKSLKLPDKEVEKIFKLENKISRMLHCDGGLFLFDKDNNLYSYSGSEFLTLENEIGIFPRLPLFSNFALAKKRLSNRSYKYFIFNLLKREVLFEIPHTIDFFFDEMAFLLKDDQIVSYKIEEDRLNVLWEFNFESLPNYYSPHFEKYVIDDVNRWVGAHNQILWIELNSSKLIGLDINTGALKYEIFEPKYIGKDADGREMIFNLGSVLNLDSENGLLIGLRDSFYLEYDLNSNSPFLKKIDLKNQFIDFHPFAFDMKDIGFLQFNNSFILGYDKMEGKFCVFDRETKNINSKVKLDFGDRKGGGAKILSSLICENYVFIGDCFGTIRIFKNE